MLFATTKSFKREWIDVLHLVEMGLRGTIQATTKVTPFETVFGNQMRLPTTWMTQTADESIRIFPESSRSVSQYIMELQRNISKIHEDIIHLQESPNTTAVKTKDVRPFEVGCHVMAKLLPVQKSLTEPRFDGPYVITSKLGTWTYEVMHVMTKKKIVRNHHHLKVCPAKLTSDGRHDSLTTTGIRASILRCQSNPSLTGIRANVPKQRVSTRRRTAPERYGFVGKREVW